MGKLIRKIIIADDDAEDIDMFCQAMREANEEVNIEVADNGKDLIRQLEKTHLPDVIILDMNMPFKSGTECLTEIRNQQRFDDVPVIMLSNSTRVSDIQYTVSGGMNYYITKPWSYKEFVSLINKICNGMVAEL